MALTYTTIEVLEAYFRHHGHHMGHLPFEVNRPAYQQLQQRRAMLNLSPYLVVGGQPVLDTGYGVEMDTSCYIDSGGITAGSGFPTPAVAVTGADYRFLPSASYVATNSALSGSPKAWFAVGKTISDYPQLVVRQQGATVDPVISSSYSYEWNHKRISLPSYTMNTKGYFQILTASGGSTNYSKASFVMVFVPHHGPGAYYPLYDSGAISTANRRFSLRYKKGVIELYAANGRILQHQVSLDHSEPIIVGFSYDGPGKIGRFVCADRRRVSRTFTTAYIDGMDMNANIGVMTTSPGSSTPNYSYVADMDVMEVNIWLNKALDFRQLEDVVTLLSSVYRVGP